MTPFEWLAIAYFVILPIASFAVPVRRRGVLYALGAIALVIVARFTLPAWGRAWAAHAYLVLGYWIPAAFVVARNEAFEAWLARADATLASLSPLFGPKARSRSRLRTAIFELAYLLCYPLVPAGFLVVLLDGTPSDVNWFWLAVLGSGYACYATLPWAAARPPRVIDSARAAPEPHSLSALNRAVLGRVSHQLVTFPSGHVAVALAVAAGVWGVSPGAAVAFAAVALTIAAGAVAGGYHYAVDVVLGLLVGAVVPMAIWTFM
jgi:membrane-associated phospholipid phosphatase